MAVTVCKLDRKIGWRDTLVNSYYNQVAYFTSATWGENLNIGGQPGMQSIIF